MAFGRRPVKTGAGLSPDGEYRCRIFKMHSAPKKKGTETKTGDWTVYILKCRGGRLYTGVTNDLEKRLAAHRSGRGARFTRAFAPVRLAWSRAGFTRSGALKREAAIKKLPRAAKEELLPGVEQRRSKK